MIEEKDVNASHSSRRDFLKNTALAAAGFIIVPRHVIGAVEKHSLAAEIAPGEVALARQRDIHGFEIEAAGGRAGRGGGGLRRFERQRLSAGGRDHAPRCRHPLRRQIE